MPYHGPASDKALQEFLHREWAEKHNVSPGLNNLAELIKKNDKIPQHYWVNRHGLAFNVATIPVNPGKKRSGKKKYKYLGFTFDNNFPKKLNNGRILYADTKKLSRKPKN